MIPHRMDRTLKVYGFKYKIWVFIYQLKLLGQTSSSATLIYQTSSDLNELILFLLLQDMVIALLFAI